MTILRRGFALLLFLLLFAPPARGQTVPASVEPSRVQNQLAPVALPPPPAGPAAVASGPAAAAPDGADKIRLVLKKVIIEDMTVYWSSQTEPLYDRLIGHEITLADVFGIAAALTAKYRNDGYILTQAIVPPQTIEGGVVRLKVVEGYVDKVKFEGAAPGSRAWLEEFGERIKATRPLTAKALERYMLLLNDLPGMTARAVLAPAEAQGASDLTIIVSQKPVSLFAETDNRGSRFIGPLQGVAGAQVNNALGLHEGISVTAAVAPDGWPDRELSYGAVSWQQPLDHEGTRLTVSGSIGDTHPGFTLSPFDVVGIARAFTIQLQHAFLRSRNMSFTGSAKFDYLDSNRSDNLGLPPTEDRLRVLRAGGTLQVADSLGGADTATAELSQGLNVFNASRPGDPNMTHPRANPQFFKATLEASRLQHLAGFWSLYTAASGQKASGQLLASEQFGVGGATYGSAYDASEITGDDGIAARVELRADNAFRTPLPMLQLYGFYDVGQVWDPGNSVAQDRIRSIASAGVGFRASLTDRISAGFEAAKPLTRPVATENDKEMRYFGMLTFRY